MDHLSGLLALVPGSHWGLRVPYLGYVSALPHLYGITTHCYSTNLAMVISISVRCSNLNTMVREEL